MVARRSGTRSNESRRMRLSVRSRNQRSPRLRQEPEVGWRFGLNRLETADELLMPMARHAVADHVAIQHAPRGEQRRRPVTFVVVRHRPARGCLERQVRLRPIQRWLLRLLVDRQHPCAIRRIEGQPDVVHQRLDERLVSAQLEPLRHVRLQLVTLPDVPDRRFTEALGVRHRARAPLGRVRWRGVQRRAPALRGSLVPRSEADGTTASWRRAGCCRRRRRLPPACSLRPRSSSAPSTCARTEKSPVASGGVLVDVASMSIVIHHVPRVRHDHA